MRFSRADKMDSNGNSANTVFSVVAGSRRRVRRSTRRAFLGAAAAWSVLAWIEAVFAQPKPKPAIVGWLSLSSRESDADRLAPPQGGPFAPGCMGETQFSPAARG